MIRDYVGKYYFDQDRNCAEALLLAANEALGLGLAAEDAKLVAAFGGGLSCGTLCGALAGAAAVLGRVMVDGRAHATPGFKEASALLKQTFEAREGGLLCTELRPRYYTDRERCFATVLLAADVLEETLSSCRKKP